MSSPEFTLSYCSPSDVEGMAQVYRSAFASNDIATATFSAVPLDEFDRWLDARFLAQLKKREMRSIKITHDATGTIAAFLRYQVPHVLSEEEAAQKEKDTRFREEEKKAGRDPNWPVGANLAICDEKFGALAKFMTTFVDGSNMYVAHLIATSPDFQRKGLANMLLRHVLDQADKEGRKTYIEATPSGHPVYHKLGFRDVARVEVDLTKYGGSTIGTNVCMIREPQPLMSI